MKYQLSERQKEENRIRAREWYKNNKSKCYERLKKQSVEWAKNNKERVLKLHQEWVKRIPWVRTYRSIVSRCHSHKFYIDRNIKCKIRPVELKELWFRDEAFKMKKPTIDRIDNKGDYIKDNCRYIELSENLERREFSEEARRKMGLSAKGRIPWNKKK